LFRRLRYWLRQRELERDLAGELEHHRAMRQQELEREGLPAAEAGYASRRALGNTALAREDARSVWIWPWLESVRQDLGYAGRSLRRQPGFTLVAVSALASGIGLNTSLFTAFNALALRPWPVHEPERVVNVFNLDPRELRGRAGGAPWGFSLSELRYLSEHSRTFAGLFAVRTGGGDFTLGEEDARAAWVSADYFSVLGVGMMLGRGFLPAEDRLEAPGAVAVISHGFWRSRFGADPAIVGREIRLEDVPFVVVGIAPREFTGTSGSRVDVWMPLSSVPLLRPDERWVASVLRKPENCCLGVAGRLAPGVSREQAQAELTLLSRRFRSASGREASEILLTGTQSVASPAPPNKALVQTFLLLFVGVTLVLLLACANVGNLLLARAAARRREIAVRLSLGASRGRVARQLLTEGLVLACLAGVVGVAIAHWLPSRILAHVTFGAASLRLAPDALVLGYTLVLCVVSCVLFALAPALHATRSSVAAALKRGSALPGVRLSLRSLLLSVQVALSVVLLVAASLLVRGLEHATRSVGLRLGDLTVVSFEVPARGYGTARTAALSLQLERDLQVLASRFPLALTSTPPLGSGNIKASFRLPGRSDDHFNSVYEVSAGYFGVLELPVVAGRTFGPEDAGRKLILVNETLARRHWGSAGAALGQRIVSEPPWGGWNQTGELEIVGVVRDAHMTSLGEIGSTVYQPLSGRMLPQVVFPRSASGALASVRQVAARVEPRLRVRTAPAADNLDRQLSRAQLAASLAGAMGALALALAIIGMSGVFAYWVHQHVAELGIRIALGATSRQVVRLVLGASSRAVLLGLAAGLLASLAGSRLLESHLYGLSPLDPAAHIGVAVVLALAAVLATYGPLRRALRVDPAVALRRE
jgi:predicted permease